jgi:hypothetical protein
MINENLPVLTAEEWWKREKEKNFQEWLEQRCDEDENPWGVKKHENLLREAYHAGYANAAQWIE